MIVIIGSKGMLGRAWCELLSEAKRPFRSYDLPEVDLRSADSLDHLLAEDPFELVVNCAAYTDVDGAETHEEIATEINGDAVGTLAARAAGANLLHYSTDYVFDGKGDQPYPVDAPRHPVNAYGRSKLAGELAIEEAQREHLLIRTSWLYAPWGKNFVNTIARLADERDELRVVDDQRGRPTSAMHLARTSLALHDGKHRGTYHVTDGGECTWYGFARAIVEATGARCRVVPCTSDEYPRPAPRPAYSVLDLSRTEAAVGHLPEWSTNLEEVLRERS